MSVLFIVDNFFQATTKSKSARGHFDETGKIRDEGLAKSKVKSKKSKVKKLLLRWFVAASSGESF